jgi:hypothetical protein
VYGHALVVFPLETNSAFCILQSRIHEIWARFFGSSMKDDLRYTPSNCFETFPFPLDWETNPTLETVGKNRKKPWRYRWSETVHDEVLARLLKLNQERAAAEIQGAKPKRRKEPAKISKANQAAVPHSPKQLDLIPPDTQQLDLL